MGTPVEKSNNLAVSLHRHRRYGALRAQFEKFDSHFLREFTTTGFDQSGDQFGVHISGKEGHPGSLASGQPDRLRL
jgi:hypothetical protein